MNFELKKIFLFNLVTCIRELFFSYNIEFIYLFIIYKDKPGVEILSSG